MPKILMSICYKALKNTIMKTLSKKNLINGVIVTFSNDDDVMCVTFSRCLGKFICEFNAKILHSCSTFGSMERFADKMISKHNLKEV